MSAMDQRERQKQAAREYMQGDISHITAHLMTSPPAEMQKTMAWLRNKSGMKIKTGVLHQKRVEYFKGGHPNPFDLVQSDELNTA
jgi:hypothetical protein